MFPSILNTFNRPTPTDRLNSPSHSALHNTVSSALGQVEAFIGRVGDSSTLGTLVYDVRSPDSGGGGHVQSANKGGTGQTSYTKGDLLVATSSSVISKLAAGIDGQVLFANSSTASGVQWSNGVGTAESLIPINASGNNTTGTGTFTTSILGHFGMVTVPLNISANTISINCTTVSEVGNAVKIGVYSENGQNRVTSVFVSILGTGIITRPISSVFFAAGNYWTALVPVTDASNNFTVWRTDNSPGEFAASVAGKKKFTGVMSVVAGTLPTTFSPSSLVSLSLPGIVVRLDN